MFLADAYEDILTRKAEEAPGGIAPLNPSWTSPDYDPAKAAYWESLQAKEGPPPPPQQIVITASKLPKTPAPIQIPLLQFTNPWDQITARRAASVAPQSSYWPWIVGGLAGLAALLMLTGDKKSPRKPSPVRRAAPVRRLSYARGRR